MQSEPGVNVYHRSCNWADEAGWIPLGIATDRIERSLMIDWVDAGVYEHTIERMDGVTIVRTLRLGRTDSRTYVWLFDRTHPRLRRIHEAYRRRGRSRRRRQS
jgi:hypothetical protein